MVIQAYWPGATTVEMEQQVIDQLEKKLQETPWLDFINSYSKPGEAVLAILLKESTPPDEVPGIWYDVRKKVADIRHELPAGVQGPFFDDEFGDTFGSIYAFTADGFSHAELKDSVDYVRQELLGLNNISKVNIIGAQEEKIYIEGSDNWGEAFQSGLEVVNQVFKILTVCQTTRSHPTPTTAYKRRSVKP